MLLLENVDISVEIGIRGDHRGKSGDRQVTILAREVWDDVCRELGKNLPWTARRANLFIEGFSLEGTKGKYIRINGLCLEITGETKPCQRMDEFYQNLQDKLEPSWRGGATCRVISPGKIFLGDEVILTDNLD